LLEIKNSLYTKNYHHFEMTTDALVCTYKLFGGASYLHH